MTVSICAGPNRSTGVLPRSRSSHHPRRVATTCHPATENTSFAWIESYYNRRRRHSTLGYLTPTEYELGFRKITDLPA
ncbi:Mobile element protein [Pseudonocardia sp. Ae706_Ps2]|nr:Mobile element protein [Pseudonocardia sp. Ae706_Ps2]